MKRTVFAFLFVASSAFAARDPANYDRVLLPFSGSTSGVGGSWFAQWWIRNDGDTVADVFPLALFCGLCPRAFHLSIAGPIPPHTTPMYFPGDVLPGPLAPVGTAVTGTPPGVLLYIERGKVDQLAITAFLGRFTFAGSQRRSVSSALRAVHENRFRRGRQSIFLPILPDTRTMLRIYALPETVDDPAVSVRWATVSEMSSLGPPPLNGETPLGTASLRLITPDSEGFRSECAAPCDVPHAAYKPAVAEMTIFNLPTTVAASPVVRVEIEPASPNVRWWAIVSVTNGSDDVQFFPLTDF